MAKIIEVNNESISFDDGSYITYDHEQDCCETNYADFEQLEDIAYTEDFDTNSLVFESVDGGFRFGNEDNMFFIPCYSEQNGYYTTQIDIYYNDERVLSTECNLNLI